MASRPAGGVVVFVCCAAALLSGQAQNVPPVFRSEVNLVQVHAYVTDAQGNPVTGLAVDDFDVRENGKPQSVAYFLPFNIPIDPPRDASPSPASLAEPDVQSNGPRERRLYVIAVDELRPENGLRTRAFLRRFVERYVGGDDVAAVVLVGRGRREDTQEFTSNRRLLLRAIDRISGWPSEAPPIIGVNGPQAIGFLRPLAQERLLALQDLVKFLGSIPSRRKAVLLLTEDIGVDVQAAIETPLSSSMPLFVGDIAREMVRTALRGNVTIYPIDPNRLTLEDVTGISESLPTIAQDRTRRRLEMDRRINLRSLAEATGGFALVSSNDVEGAFERVVRENSTYYLLGYYSTDDKADGKFRRLDVRVKRPGLRVHTINGYLAPRERVAETRKKPGVVDVLSSPLAISDLPMQIVAAPYRGEREEAVVAAAIEVDGRALAFETKDDTFTAQLEVGYVVSGPTSVTSPVHYRVDLALAPDSYEKARKTGVRILLETQLRPGTYQLRAGVAQIGGRSGSVVYDLEVPGFAREPLTLSGLSVTSVEASGLHVSSGGNLLTGAMPGPMTAIREFGANDRVAVYAEVYDNIRDAPSHTVTVRAELRSEAGSVVRTVADERSSTALHRRQGGYGFLFEIPLSGVAPGAYVLHVGATASVGGRPEVTRAIPIRVR